VSSLQVNAVQQNIDKMNEEQRQMIAAAEHDHELLLVTLSIDHKYKTAMNKPIILAVLVEHRLVADTDRHRQTDRHRPMASTAGWVHIQRRAIERDAFERELFQREALQR